MCKTCKAKNTSKAVEITPAQCHDADVFLDVVSPQQKNSPSLIDEIKLLRTEISNFRLDMTKLTTLVTNFASRLDSIEERVSHLEAGSGAAADKDNEQLQQSLDSIELLKKQLNESEQEMLLNDVEITGISENSGENLLHITITLAQKLGLAIDERDIANVHRRGVRRRGEGEGSGAGEAPQSRPIVVRLTRRHLRDELLRAARVRRGADTAGTGVQGEPRRFYVNEHLTYSNRKLFFAAREKLGRSKNWRFVWTRAGHVYARRDNKSKVVNIKSEDDINKVFYS
ncbi:uncharacterized protein LOC123704862 [Colias croceus]|uniref:uncharacterized protein LOC123701162 n=1 Tax=Colias crocea TaxID=72248 RepID=UPI001E281923|nr:uncharacterized protein LOC123701162 [Colias croceus]XP_045509309.1 uncharacterized protein LOC123704862 [Colias croceus]